MDPKALRNLHLDVRLQQREGWIAKAELEQSLEALPDVSDKILPPEEAAASEAALLASATPSLSQGVPSPAPELSATPSPPEPDFGREE